jgi:hypothetical protein
MGQARPQRAPPQCLRCLGVRQRQTIALAVFKACTEEGLPWVRERGRDQAEKDGVQGRPPVTKLVKVGGRSAPAAVAPVTIHPSACHSLLRSLLVPSCTLMSYNVSLAVV